MYCLGAPHPQVKNIRTEELGSDPLQFRELFLYSLDITDLKHAGCAMARKRHLHMYVFITSQIALIAHPGGGLERRVLHKIKLENSNKQLFIL